MIGISRDHTRYVRVESDASNQRINKIGMFFSRCDLSIFGGKTKRDMWLINSESQYESEQAGAKLKH